MGLDQKRSKPKHGPLNAFALVPRLLLGATCYLGSLNCGGKMAYKCDMLLTWVKWPKQDYEEPFYWIGYMKKRIGFPYISKLCTEENFNWCSLCHNLYLLKFCLVHNY